MKYLILLPLILCSFNSMEAKPVFFGWGGEKIIKIADFPDNDVFKNKEGRYVDAGIKYKQVAIFFIPVWNYDEKWCGYISDKYYIDLNKTELDALATLADISLPEDIELPFWDKFGGKLLFLSLLTIYTLYALNNPEEEPTT